MKKEESPSRQKPAAKKPIQKRWWFWAVLICLGLGVLGNLGKGRGKGDSLPVSTLSDAQDENLRAPEPVVKPEDAKTPEPEEAAVPETPETTEAGGTTLPDTPEPADTPAPEAAQPPEQEPVPLEEAPDTPDSTVPAAPQADTEQPAAPAPAEASPTADAPPATEAQAEQPPDAAPSDAAPTAPTEMQADGENHNTYDTPEQQSTEASYVLNTNSHKFHLPGCRDVPKIKPENYSTTSKSRDEVIAMGYSPCGHCHP